MGHSSPAEAIHHVRYGRARVGEKVWGTEGAEGGVAWGGGQGGREGMGEGGGEGRKAKGERICNRP